MLKKLILLCTYIFSLNLGFSAVIGDFSDTDISAGYINFDEGYPFNTGLSFSEFDADGIERRSPSKLLKTYLNPDELEHLIDETKEYLKSVMMSYCMNDFRKKVNSYFDCRKYAREDRKFRKKWRKNKFNLALNMAIDNLESLKSQVTVMTVQEVNRKENQQLLSSFMSALEIIYGIRAENDDRGKYIPFMASLMKLRALVKQNFINENTNHAANLLTPIGHPNLFYSYEELEQLKANGQDISLLDPPNSGVWRKPKVSISSYDTSNYNKDSLKQLNRVLSEKVATKLLDHEAPMKIVFKGDNFSGGATPKFDAYIDDVKFKVKFITDKHSARPELTESYVGGKAFWGSEVNVEPVVNNIAAALGFTVDATYFKNSVHLYFDEEELESDFESSLEKLIEGLTKKYGLIKNIESAFKNIHIDQNGRKFVVLKGVTLEQKSDRETDLNLGFYQRQGLGKVLKRDHRALYLLSAFLADVDTKDDNTKVKLVSTLDQNGKEQFKIALSNSDMGSALGTGHPNFYNFKLVSSVSKQNNKLVLQLNHPKLYAYELSKHVNIDDAKWFTRRLAQLSLEQMERAFSHAGFPKVVAKYYALLMAKRRNELVNALGMVGERIIDDGGRPFSIGILEEFNGTVPGFEKYFKNGVLTDPEGEIYNPEFEPFRRYWGVSFKRGHGDPLDQFMKEIVQLYQIKGMHSLNEYLLQNFSITNQGIGFQRGGIYFQDLVRFCDSNCFAQGITFGAKGLIPLRYIFENPDKDSKKPFILVDVLRAGFFVGTESRNFISDVGINLSEYISSKAGGNVYFMKEFIRVVEVDSMNDYFNYVTPVSISNNTFSNDYEKQLELKDTDYNLITSQYIGLRGNLKFRIVDTPMSAVIGMKNKLVKRTLLTHQDNEYYLRYDQGKEFGFHAGFNIFDFLVSIPLAEYSYTSTKLRSRVVKFKEGTIGEVVLNCMKLNVNCEEGYDISRRQTRTTYSNTNFNFFNLFGTNKTKEQVFREFYDLLTGEVKKEKFYVYKQGNFRYSKFFDELDDYISTAYIDDSGNMNLAIDVDFSRPQSKRHHLTNFLSVYESLLPEDIIPYETDHIKYYLGLFIGKINIVFDKNALKRFFDEKLKSRLCFEYGSFQQISNVLEVCTGKIKNNSFARQYLSFKEEYLEAFASYNQLTQTNIEFMKYKDLKTISKFFLDKRFKHRVVEFLISMSKDSEFKRDVLLQTELNAFPGNEDTIKESHYLQGDRERFEVLDMEIIGDKLFETLHPIFYDHIKIRS